MEVDDSFGFVVPRRTGSVAVPTHTGTATVIRAVSRDFDRHGHLDVLHG